MEVEIPRKCKTLMCPRAFIASEDETAQACMEVFIPCVTRGPVAEVRAFLTTIAHGGCRSAARDAIYLHSASEAGEGRKRRTCHEHFRQPKGSCKSIRQLHLSSKRFVCFDVCNM